VPREKPSARSVPISAMRACTAAYIVFVAPNAAPKPATTARNTTRIMKKFALSACFA
jgi:hypothetical protein